MFSGGQVGRPYTCVSIPTCILHLKRPYLLTPLERISSFFFQTLASRADSQSIADRSEVAALLCTKPRPRSRSSTNGLAAGSPQTCGKNRFFPSLSLSLPYSFPFPSSQLNSHLVIHQNKVAVQSDNAEVH